MKRDDVFVVWLHTAPYVRKYLTENFGCRRDGYDDLVDLRSDPYLHSMFVAGLERHSERFDRRLELSGNHRRNCKVGVLITHDRFNRCGWALSLTEERRLNQLLESRCKTMLLGYLSTMYMVYGNLHLCISKFYETFGYDDDTWPEDSIRKIWLREKKIPKTNMLDDFTAKISAFFLEKLSQCGTISHRGQLMALERIENMR